MMRPPIVAAWCASALCFCCGIATDANGQGTTRALVAAKVPTLPVVGMGDSVDGEFDRVSSVRELADGRVIVADIIADRLYIVDWRVGTATQFGVKGRGPGEYVEIGRVFPSRGDSSVLEDPTIRKWLVMDGVRIGPPLNSTAKYTVDLFLAGVDTLGRYLEVSPHRFAKGRNGRPVPIRDFADTLVAVLVHRSGERRDTIAALRGSYRGHAEARKVSNGVAMDYWFYSRIRTEDQTVLFPDGWISVVRSDPYTIEWHPPKGAAHTRRTLPFDSVRVDDMQKRHAMYRTWDAATRPLFKPEEMPGWPTVLPPFERDALLAFPEGWLGIVRTPDARVQKRYVDVVGRDGILRFRLELPDEERVVGVSASYIYSVKMDSDDVEHLVRRRRPR